MSVTFATKTWGGDWEKMLAGAYGKKWRSCKYDFDDLMLMVNNGVPEDVPVRLMAEADRTVLADLFASEVLAHYGVTEDSFEGGYRYSICELAAILLCPSEYMCWMQGDCLMDPASDWVSEGIGLLEQNPIVTAVSPASEANAWHDKNGLDQFFSDQAFLVRTKDFQDPSLMAGGQDIPEYPAHGGDSFEKKVAQWMRRNGTYRKILTDHWHAHPAW